LGAVTSPARQRSRGAPIAAAVAIGLWALAELFGLLVSLFFAVVRCDESCNENLTPSVRQPGWAHWTDSWQWSALWVLAASALVVTLVAGVLLLRGRRTGAAIGVGLSVALAGAWGLLILSA
jgi:hypothetical protein